MNGSGGVSMLWVLAAEAPPDDGSNGPVVAIVLAAIAMVGTVITAVAPSLLEFIKNRGTKKTPSPSPPAPEPVAAPMGPQQALQDGSVGLGMIEQMFADYRSQRDISQKRYDDLMADLDEARELIREQSVYIAQLEGRGRRNYGGHGRPTSDPRAWEPR